MTYMPHQISDSGKIEHIASQIHKFDTKTKKELYFGFLILGIFTFAIWLGIPTYYRWGHLSLGDYLSRPSLGFIALLAIVFALCWNSYKTRFQYELSTEDVTMRSGSRVLKHVPLSSVQGFIVGRYRYSPVRLKIAKQHNFVFYDIYGSTCERLIAVLQQIGVTRITSKST